MDAPYEPPESLWQLIKSVAEERELDVIKRVIGESLVETTLDLHAEIDTLLEIWRDYRHETLQNIAHMRSSKKEGSTHLPEPPNQRETLKKEILFFVSQLREQFKENDESARFSAKILTNNHNLNVINYVLNSSTTTTTTTNSSQVVMNGPLVSRPGSSLNKQTGLETPIINRSSRSRSSSVNSSRSERTIRYRSVSRSSFSNDRLIDTPFSNNKSNNNNQSVFQEELELMVDEDKLNVRDIDECVDNLRRLLEEERDALLHDVEFLYECIDGESEYRAQSRLVLKEPTLNELKEERKRLEADLLSTTGKNQYEIGKLMDGVKSRSNIKSPMGRLSPPSSAGSIKSRASSSTLSLNQITTTADSSRVAAATGSHVIKRPIVNGATSRTTTTTKINLNLPSHERSSLSSSTNMTKPTQTTTPPVRKAAPTSSNSTSRQIDSQSKLNTLTNSSSRNNSAMSIASSVGSSTTEESSSTNSPTTSSSNHHKQTAVQKFRQMVLDHRDDD